MFKTLVTLVRGRVVAIGEEVADQNALAIRRARPVAATGCRRRAGSRRLILFPHA